MSKDIKTLDDLTPDGQNFNKHTQFGQKLLEDSLRKFGAGRSILVDRDGNIIAGNSTTETAAAIGMEKVKVVQTDGTELVVVQRTDLSLDSPQGRELALADNMTALKGIDIDLDKVSEMLGEDMAKAWGMELPKTAPEAHEDDFDPDKPVDTVCKKGDIWKLGNHRLMCGDSTDPADVALLMDGEKADMCFTDPPYGYEYQSNFREKTPKMDVLKNDDKILNIMPIIAQLCDGWVFLCTTWKVIGEWLTQFTARRELTNMVVWSKGGGGLGDLSHTFSTDYEIILVSNGGKEITGKRLGSVWEIMRDSVNNYEHPTQKPVQLAATAIENVSKQGDLVLDLFGGSGSTLIAAEQLNRRCYMMELDPHYCDVIIARWEKLTNQKAGRIEG